jgi:predicted MFS family arabinose efflux permease
MTEPRQLAVALAGFCAFLQLYAPQSLLPLFAGDFGVTPAAAGLVISASAFAVAITAPFAGALADRFGRRRMILGASFLLVVPALLIALSDSLDALVAWRFVQGLLLPPIFTVIVAYIGEEWPAEEVPAVIGLYTAAAALGGFMGRLLAGIAADLYGWRGAFVLMAAINLAGALALLRWLAPQRHFVPMEGLTASLRAMVAHFGNPRLLATFATGFCVLFCFVATFTYVSFHLAAPPFDLSPGALGAIFVVYLLGVVVTPVSGRGVVRFGRRRVALLAFLLWGCGIALTLVAALPAIVAGLALASASGFLIQALAAGFLATAGKTARSSAVGLYGTFYYVGGSIGGVLPGVAYAATGWAGVVAMVGAAVVLMAALTAWAWAK